jgi:uncharacterized phiE125 gp8 family phage protein
MVGNLTLVQRPQSPVVELATVKKFLHVDTAADDERIELLIAAATQRLDGRDGILGRALSPQTWRLDLPAFGASVRIPLPPLIAVTGVQYRDGAGVLQTLATDQYRVSGSWLIPATGVTWPTPIDLEPDAVQITFDAGYRGDESPENNAVLETIRQAIIMMVISWYDRPGLEDIPEVVNSLVAPHKVNRLGRAYA